MSARRPDSDRTVAPMLLNAVYTAAPIGICLVDDRGAVRSLNPEGVRLLEWTEAECLGRSLHDLIDCRPAPGGMPLDGDSASCCPIDQVLRTGLPAWAPQAVIRGRDGRSLPVEYKCVPFSGPTSSGALFCFHDRRAAVQMEQDLHRLASIPAESPFPIVELDEEGHLFYANPSMIRLLERFGYTEQGRPAVLPANLPDLVRECVTTQVCLNPVEVVIDGACYVWTFCAVPACRMLRAYGTDLTTIRQSEQTMRTLTDLLVSKNLELDAALAKAEEAAQIKTRFLATMSHEIRTPLNGVIGMLDLLQTSPLPPDQADCAGTARRSAEALLDIINGILDFSKIEAGKLTLETLDFDLRAVVEDVIGLLAEQAARQGVELIGVIDADVPTAVQGDPGRLRQILLNLVGNAVKFTAQGDIAVRVELEHREALGVNREEKEDDKNCAAENAPHASRLTLRFSVADAGIGIPAGQQARLFQPFFQADSSTTRKYGGTGLGLAISKQLTELMGGTIGVDSQPGRGSTFWFTAALRAQPAQPTARPRRDGRALIVAGSDTMRLLLRHHLVAWGLTDLCEDDGPRALQLLRDAAARGRPFTLAIVDHRLRQPPDVSGQSGHDGPSLARAIRAETAPAATPVLVLAPAGRRAGPTAPAEPGLLSLSKPIRQAALYQRLEALLEQPPGLSAWAQAYPDGPTAPAQPHPADHRAMTAPSSGLRLLVVEDNEVNQTVAVRLLQRLGYQADVAANGLEAMAACARTAYAAILMDCQMPEMDGYAATRCIREREATKNGERGTMNDERGAASQQSGIQHAACSMQPLPRIPIIAMTANTLPGDRERCLTAGMDDYLAKPITLEALRTVLARWLSPDGREGSWVRGDASEEPGGAAASSATPHPSPMTPHPPRAESAFDHAAALARLGGDAALLQTMAQLFLRHSPLLMDELRQALAQRDYETIAELAHKLHGMVEHFCAARTTTLAAQVHETGRHRDPETVVRLCRELGDELLALTQALTTFLQETTLCES